MMISKDAFYKGMVFLISNIINAAIPFLLLPILTRFLSPADYGIVTMFATILSLIGAFVGLSVHGAINVAYFKLSRDEFAEYVTSCIILLIVSAASVFVIVYLFGGYFEKITGLSHKWMLIAVLVSFFQFFINIRLTIWIVTGYAKQYGFFQVSQTTANAILSLFFVIIAGFSWEGRLLGQTIAVVFFGFLAVFLIYKAGHLKWPKNKILYCKDAIKFGLPLIPHVIGSFVMYNTDRIIISNVLDMTSIGIYAVGLQLGQAMGLASDSFNKVYAPWLMKNLSDKRIDRNKIILNTYISMCLLVLGGVLWFFIAGFLLKHLFGNEFQSAREILIYTCLGFSVTGLYYLVTNYVFYVQKTKYLVFITFFCGLLNIPMTYFSVFNFGIVGAAASFFIVQLIFFMSTWILAARLFPMPWFSFLKVKNA
mgnify:CR=1 FL=1